MCVRDFLWLTSCRFRHFFRLGWRARIQIIRRIISGKSAQKKKIVFTVLQISNDCVWEKCFEGQCEPGSCNKQRDHYTKIISQPSDVPWYSFTERLAWNWTCLVNRDIVLILLFISSHFYFANFSIAIKLLSMKLIWKNSKVERETLVSLVDLVRKKCTLDSAIIIYNITNINNTMYLYIRYILHSQNAAQIQK